MNHRIKSLDEETALIQTSIQRQKQEQRKLIDQKNQELNILKDNYENHQQETIFKSKSIYKEASELKTKFKQAKTEVLELRAKVKILKEEINGSHLDLDGALREV